MIYYGHKMQKTQITIVKGGKNMNYEKEKNGTRKIAKVIIYSSCKKSAQHTLENKKVKKVVDKDCKEW